MSLLQRVISGLNFLGKGYGALKEVPGIKIWMAIPFVLYFGAFALAISWAGPWMAVKIAALTISAEGLIGAGFIAGLVIGLLKWLLWAVYIVLVIYFVYVIASVIAAPFHGMVAEKVLVHRGAIPHRPFKFGRWLKMTMSMVFISLVRAIILLLVGLALFVLSFIPVVNIAGIYISFLIIAFDTADYSLELKEMGLRKRFRYLMDNLPEFSGMAAIMGLTVIIPGLTLLVMPLAVAGSAEIIAAKKVDL